MPRDPRSDFMDDEERQLADRNALLSGDLPVSAAQRMSRQRAERNVFTSNLSVREFLVLKNVGVQPLGQVMGTAFMTLPRSENQSINSLRGINSYSQDYRLSRNNGGTLPTSFIDAYARHLDASSGGSTNSSYGYGGGYSSRYSQPYSGELPDQTDARLSVRQLALKRLADEATILGASGVVGVKFITKVHDKPARTLEFTIFGTAVHLPDRAPNQTPFISLLDGQEFWQLWQAGFEPKGIALGVCSYTDCTDAMSIHQRSYNQEVAVYTQCFYEARETAMQNFVRDLVSLGARGSVGMKIDYDFVEAESEVEFSEGNPQKYLHLVTHFVVMGTAIARRPLRTAAGEAPANTNPRRVLIYDLRKSGRASVEFSKK